MRFAYLKPVACSALLVLFGAVGCGDKTATPDPAASASAAKPASAIKRPDPLVTKTFKAESCQYGALSLKLARAAYTASVGETGPDAQHIPDFGAEPVEPAPTKESPTAPAGSASPAASAAPAGSAKPAASAKAAAPPRPAIVPPAPAPKATGSAVAAAPKTSASAGAALPAMRDPSLMARIRSVPYERFVRSCHVAAGIKDPASPELDTALKGFADYALPLAKAIAEANTYYQKKEYEGDDFKKGKEYHQKLTEGFAKLDEQVKLVDDALAKFKTEKPVDVTGYSESQKLAAALVTVASDAALKLVATPTDPAALAAEVAKIEAAVAPLKKLGEDNKEARDPWAMLVVPPAENFASHLKALGEQPAAEIKVSKLVNGLTLFSRVHEGNNRALSRKLSEGGPGRLMPNNRMLRPKAAPGMRAPTDQPAKPADQVPPVQ